jgi:hypothetical protein
MASAPAQGLQVAAAMKFGQGVVATDRYSIDAHLGQGAAAAGGHHLVGDAEGAQHPQSSSAVGAAGQHGDFHPGVAIRRCGLAPAARRFPADRCRFLQTWGGTGRVCLYRQAGAGTGRRRIDSFTPLQQPHLCFTMRLGHAILPSSSPSNKSNNTPIIASNNQLVSNKIRQANQSTNRSTNTKRKRCLIIRVSKPFKIIRKPLKNVRKSLKIIKKKKIIEKQLKNKKNIKNQ